MTVPARIFLALALAATAMAQDDDPTRALETRARYLARRPYHARVFDEFVEIARQAKALDEWRTRFAGEAAGGDESAAVLLARLDAAAGDVDAALARLDEIDAEDPARDALRARLLVTAEREEEAADDYARAVAAMERGDERAELRREHADLLVRLGRLDEARAAYAALAEERPADLLLRLDVAEACARGGLVNDALGHYRRALDVAAGDPEAESRAHFALGQLAEARSLVEEAAASYRAALDRLGRGHWLRDDVFTRLLALQRRRGTLGAWREELATRLDGGLSDPLPFEDLARVAAAMGEPDVAADLLARAAERFPADARLARRRVDLARDLGRVDEWIDLLQARVAEEGESVAARLELAEAFLDADRIDAAHLQWQRVAELGAQRPEVLADLARRRAETGEDAPVVALLRRVVELASGDLRGWADLARHHRARGREDAARVALEDAEAALPENAAARAELAELWLELGERERALGLLEGLREVAPGDVRLTRRAAEVLVELGRGEEARALLRPLVEAARDGSGLRSLVRAWLDSFETAAERTVALAVECETTLAGEGDRAGFWIAALGSARVGDPVRAGELLAWRLERGGPDAAVALEERVQLALSLGELDVALPLLERLAALEPQGLFALEVEAITRLVAARRPDEASVQLARLDPGDSAVRLRDLASLHRRVNQIDEAIALLERAARIAEDDPRPWRELAELCRAEFRFTEALEHYRVAYRLANGRPRAEIAVDLRRFLDEHGRLEAEVQGLAALGEARPLEAWASLLAVDLLIAHGRPFEARDLLDARIEALPFEPLFIAKRAELAARMGFLPERRADLETLRAMGVGGDVNLRLLEARLAEDREAWVGDLIATAESPVDVAARLLVYGRHAEARDLLERARVRRASVELDTHLADAYEGLDRPRELAVALERAVAAVADPDRELLERLGRVQAELGRRERALEIGRLLLARVRPRVAAPYYAAIGESSSLPPEVCRAVRAGFDRRPDALAEASEDLLGLPGGDQALAQLLDELLVEVLERSRAPTGRSPAHFALELVERRAELGRDAAEFDPERPVTWLLAAFLGTESTEPARWRAARERWDGEPATGAALVKLGVGVPELAGEAARFAVALAGRLEALPHRALLDLEATRRRQEVDRELRALRIPTGDEATALYAAWIDGEHRTRGPAAWLEPMKLRVEAAEAARLAGAEDVIDAALDGFPDDGGAPFAALLLAEARVRAGRDAGAAVERVRAALAAVSVDVPGAPRSPPSFVPAAWTRIARAFRETDRIGEGYELLGRAGQQGHANRLVEEPGDREAASAHLERRLDGLYAVLPERSDPSARSRAVDLAVLTSELRWRDDRSRALETVERALAEIGEEPRLLALRARLFESAGRSDEALEDLRRAVARSPTSEAAGDAGLQLDITWEEDPHRGAWKILERNSADAATIHRLHLLRLALTLGDMATAGDQLVPLIDVEPPRDDAWLRSLVRATRPLVTAVPLADWELDLHRALPRNRTLLRTCVETLCASDRFDEAAAVLATFVDEDELSEEDRSLADYLADMIDG